MHLTRTLTAILILGIFIIGCGEYDADLNGKPQENNGDDVPMVLIPDGEFQMGGSFSAWNYIPRSAELPVHTVYLDAFYMDIYEVTNAQYGKFMDATGHSAKILERRQIQCFRASRCRYKLV